MDRGIVQRVLASADPQKPRCLFEGLRPEFRDLAQAITALVRPMLVAVCDNALGQCRVHTRNVLQQFARRGIHVNTHEVHAAFHRFVEPLLEQLLVHVVLVLPHPYGFRIDLDELGERILQPTADADRAADRDVQVRKFFAREHARGIHRGPGLTHHHPRWLAVESLQDRSNERLRLAPTSPVADGDQVHAVLQDQSAQDAGRSLPLTGSYPALTVTHP